MQNSPILLLKDQKKRRGRFSHCHFWWPIHSEHQLRVVVSFCLHRTIPSDGEQLFNLHPKRLQWDCQLQCPVLPLASRWLSTDLTTHGIARHPPTTTAYREWWKERAHVSQEGQPEFLYQALFLQAQSWKSTWSASATGHLFILERAVRRMKPMSAHESQWHGAPKTMSETWFQPCLDF